MPSTADAGRKKISLLHLGFLQCNLLLHCLDLLVWCRDSTQDSSIFTQGPEENW